MRFAPSGGGWPFGVADGERLKRRGYSVAAIRDLARAGLPRAVFDNADGGAETEATLRRNEEAFQEVELLTRALDGSPNRDLSVNLFGHRLAMPVMIGPTGLAGLHWPDGEIAAGRAATAAGVGYCLSHASVCTMEDLAAAEVRPRFMQIFVYRDRGFTRAFIDRARAAGYDGLVLTIDNQVTGNRWRNIVNGFTIPPTFGPLDYAGMALKLPWLLRMRKALPGLTFGNYVEPGRANDIGSLAARMNEILDPSLDWSDVDWIRKAWDKPFLLKGVLHPAEAAEAIHRGVDGVIVSNHGGRQLDGAPASLDCLPGIVEAVEGRMPVILDGGVRRGVDVVKALALGAACCLIARPHLWGLSVAGEAGVAHVLGLYAREIDRVMALLGVRRVAEIGPDHLFRPAWRTPRR
jgi:L-lactate dehydrogenase (cytochrome)/(S)-mandelate dehydrogenase